MPFNDFNIPAPKSERLDPPPTNDMSRPQSLLSLLVVTVAGIASGIYVLDPAFKELEKEKQLGGQTRFAAQHSPVSVVEAVEKPQGEIAVGEPAGSVASNPQVEGPRKQSDWSMFTPGNAKIAEKGLSSSDTKDNPS